jgi:hypothetical protein
MTKMQKGQPKERMSSDALNAEWYFPKMTRNDAEKCLESNTTLPGAFVVRPSSQRDCLALSHRNHDGSVGHALIYSTNSGFVLERTQLHLPTVLAVLQTLPLRFDAPVHTHLQSAAVKRKEKKKKKKKSIQNILTFLFFFRQSIDCKP